MSLINGLEYINTTKQKLKTRLQGKGVDVVDDTPFREYPDMVESELKNKSWQYPTSWYPLTPKAEFQDHTAEVILYDAGYDFKLYFKGYGTCSITLYGGDGGGTYTMAGNTYNLNQTYTMSGGGTKLFRLTRGTGRPTDNGMFTTFKLVISYATRLTDFYTQYLDTSHITYIPILAVRIKDSTSYSKNIHFGWNHYTSSGGILYYRGVAQYMQYCDLSMVNRLSNSYSFMFADCPSLIKVELPQGFVAPNSCFSGATSLREVIGLDFTNIHTNVNSVFIGCTKYTPPSLNYIGESCYFPCCFAGKVIRIPDMEEFSIKNYISSTTTIGLPNYENGEVGYMYKVIIPDSITKFAYSSLSCMNGSIAIIHLPSCHATLTTEPKYTSVSSGDAFLYYPYIIENGENFYLDKPIGVTIGAQYGEEHIYLPHVPLRFFYAYASLPSGTLKSITFDWENTDFDTSIDSTSSQCVIDLYGQSFEHDTLVELFNNLPPVTTNRSIRITNNPGAKTLTDEEIAIVTDKGYVLTK